jgi:hypothetical protein
MVDFVRDTPTEFREYYIQMQASKRSQAPLPSEVNTKFRLLFNLFLHVYLLVSPQSNKTVLCQQSLTVL